MQHDLFNVHARPRQGFVTPVVGATVTVLKPHKLPCQPCTGWRAFNGVLSVGSVGTVTEIRPPGVECGGYVGLCVYWPEASAAYPSGVVMAWNVVDDPEVFSFT